MIEWGTPKYIQEEMMLRKHQYEDFTHLPSRRKKYCIKTKGEHIFKEKEPFTSDWWYDSWVRGKWKEYVCVCGKKKIETKDFNWFD